MAIPRDAVEWGVPLGTYELLDYVMVCEGRLLEITGESIDPSSVVVTMSSEGAALGVEINEEDGRSPELIDDNKNIGLWLQVDPAFRDHPAFDGEGSKIPVELFFRTDSAPHREREGTWVVIVRKK